MRTRSKLIPAGFALLTSLGANGLIWTDKAMAANQGTSSSPTPPKLSMTQAEKIARSTFSIPGSYTVQSESFNGNSGSQQPAAYSFSFNQSDNTKPPGYVSVSVDADSGRIMGYSQSVQQNNFVYPVPTSAEQAKQDALTWANKLYPDEVNQVQALPLQPQFGSLTNAVTYTYNFERMVHGIPSPFDGFSITIDENGKLLSVQNNWTDLAFPSSTPSVAADGAVPVYRNWLQLHLAYNQVWHSNAKPTTELMYVQNQPPNAGWWQAQFGNGQINTPVISATTGKVINAYGKPVALIPPQKLQPLIPGGPTLPKNPPKINWDETQAVNYATKVMGITTADRLLSVNEWKNPGSDAIWNFAWKTKDGRNVNVGIDATYGTLNNFNSSFLAPKQTVVATRPTQAQVTRTVDAFVEKLFADNVGAIAVVPNNPPSTKSIATSYQITTLVNGIPDQATQGSLNVNGQTGAITNMWMNAQGNGNTTMPDPKRAISSQQAKQVWIQNRPLQLVYLLTQPTSPVQMKLGLASSPKTPQPQVFLAYAPITTNSMANNFNAISGKFDAPEQQQPYSGPLNDLANIPNAAEIKLLVQRELLTVDASGDVHPNQNLTNGAFVKLLVDALGQQNQFNASAASQHTMAALSSIPTNAPDYQEIGAAYQMGLLPTGQPFAPNQPVTRGDAAYMVALALGYGPLLAHPETFHMKSSDAASIGKDQFAAAALATTLGIFPLQHGSFGASGKVSLADAAAAVVQTAVIWGETHNGVGPIRY